MLSQKKNVTQPGRLMVSGAGIRNPDDFGSFFSFIRYKFVKNG